MHISDSTLSYLEGAYEVEPGGGEERSSTLKDHNVKTYFIKQKDLPSSARKQVSYFFKPSSWCIFDAGKENPETISLPNRMLNEQTMRSLLRPMFETLYAKCSLPVCSPCLLFVRKSQKPLRISESTEFLKATLRLKICSEGH